MRGTLTITARNTTRFRVRLSFIMKQPLRKTCFFVGQTLRKASSRSYQLTSRFLYLRGLQDDKEKRTVKNDIIAARSLITVKYFHGEQIASFHSPSSFAWPARNCILYDVSSTRNCSLSRMSCLHVGCYDRRVGEGICIYRGNSVSHRPGLSYIDQRSSLITMLQLQINKVLIGRCSIHRECRECICVRRTVCVPPYGLRRSYGNLET